MVTIGDVVGKVGRLMEPILQLTHPYRKKSYYPSEQGGSLIELSLVLPFLLIVLVGIFELGRTLSQMSWLVQTSFNAAYYGAALAGQDDTSKAAVLARANDTLFPIHNKTGAQFSSGLFDVTYITNIPANQSDVKVSFVGSLWDVFGEIAPLVLPLVQYAEFTVPYLAPSQQAIDYDVFANPSGGLYNCCGDQVAECFDHTCIPCPNSCS